jgi:hypothetical protein
MPTPSARAARQIVWIAATVEDCKMQRRLLKLLEFQRGAAGGPVTVVGREGFGIRRRKVFPDAPPFEGIFDEDETWLKPSEGAKQAN